MFSLSQIVADEYIYYRLLNMMNGNDEIVALDINREEVKVISQSITRLTILKQVTVFI